MTRQTSHCPCCTSHPLSWVRAALLVCHLTSFFSAPSSPLMPLTSSSGEREGEGEGIWQRSRWHWSE